MVLNEIQIYQQATAIIIIPFLFDDSFQKLFRTSQIDKLIKINTFFKL